MNSNPSALFSKTKVWTIDSEQLIKSLPNMKPVNDKGTHWSLTLTQATHIDLLLDQINDVGWTKVRITFCLV